MAAVVIAPQAAICFSGSLGHSYHSCTSSYNATTRVTKYHIKRIKDDRPSIWRLLLKVAAVSRLSSACLRSAMHDDPPQVAASIPAKDLKSVTLPNPLQGKTKMALMFNTSIEQPKLPSAFATLTYLRSSTHVLQHDRATTDSLTDFQNTRDKRASRPVRKPPSKLNKTKVKYHTHFHAEQDRTPLSQGQVRYKYVAS